VRRHVPTSRKLTITSLIEADVSSIGKCAGSRMQGGMMKLMIVQTLNGYWDHNGDFRMLTQWISYDASFTS